MYWNDRAKDGEKFIYYNEDLKENGYLSDKFSHQYYEMYFGLDEGDQINAVKGSYQTYISDINQKLFNIYGYYISESNENSLEAMIHMMTYEMPKHYYSLLSIYENYDETSNNATINIIKSSKNVILRSNIKLLFQNLRYNIKISFCIAHYIMNQIGYYQYGNGAEVGYDPNTINIYKNYITNIDKYFINPNFNIYNKKLVDLYNSF